MSLQTSLKRLLKTVPKSIRIPLLRKCVKRFWKPSANSTPANCALPSVWAWANGKSTNGKKSRIAVFPHSGNEILNDGVNKYFDKVPTKFADWSEDEFRSAGFRAVPGAVARRGSFVAKKCRVDAFLCQYRRIR